MPHYCCVPGCNPRASENIKVTTFSFPYFEDIKLKWVDAIGRTNWNPSKYSRVCIKHFREEDFAVIPSKKNKYHQLSISAVPSRFLPQCQPPLFLPPQFEQNEQIEPSSLVEHETTNPTIEHSTDNSSSSTLFFTETDSEMEDDLFINSSSSSSGVMASSSSGVVASTTKRNQTKRNKSTEISEPIPVLKEPTREYDSIDYYCMSLAADMKTLEPSEQRRIRLEITKIMCTAKYKD